MSPSLKLVLSLATVLSCVFPTFAHPGEHHDHAEVHHEIVKRNAHGAMIQRGLAACASNPEFRALKARGETRRYEKARAMRKARGLDMEKPYKTRRDLSALEQFETVNHNYTSSGYDLNTSPEKLFASYKNVSCILTPEVTEGPYYVTGEYFRTNVTDGQEGVHVHLEYQYIDISTCKAVSGLYLDTWNANSTGVYSGVVASGNGNNTFLRGVTETDEEGVAAFDTLFPGHYQGRATHTHLIAHTNGSINRNGTYTSGNIAHVGQIFFDESLRSAVEEVYPYNTNTQVVVSNDDDMWAPEQADSNYDPFPEWAYLGDSVSDGLLMWISVGINMSASYNVSVAGTLTANGGVPENTGNFTAPSGTPPAGKFPANRIQKKNAGDLLNDSQCEPRSFCEADWFS
ncbi:aromatic compound dioxygenase [Viridothelium virens]|uniref:Aromatic compound dioxygenase n=1 Tax=Viridothelium virens TaxID=1048519 RepID=A0A6A6GWV0_VIRVR|nr:aromatic compound dioxygenase [Viridothelium virens]